MIAIVPFLHLPFTIFDSNLKFYAIFLEYFSTVEIFAKIPLQLFVKVTEDVAIFSIFLDLFALLYSSFDDSPP